jgi:hypothetical protein
MHSVPDSRTRLSTLFEEVVFPSGLPIQPDPLGR